MSNRWPGGLIRKTPVTPTVSSAVGVWTLAEALYWQKQGQWPTPGDPDFENVTLLLPGNGTNGAQNNTFLDGSTNNFTLTRNGDTTQGSFSPYGDLWSNYFDGSGDYIDVASNAAFGFGTGDFTVEGWFFATAPTSGNKVAIDFRASGYSGQQWVFGFGNSVTPYYYDGSDKYATSSMVANTWNHVAWVRSAGSVYMYLNGVSVFTATASSVGTASSNVRVGADANGSFSQPCYISNLRIVKGTAVYTSSFTPPTAPVTAISGTSLLTCQSNRFRDASANNFTITRNGDVRVTNFAPFNPSAAYSPAVNGGSGYFDGNGDSLSAASVGASLSQSNFTIEAWVYLTAAKVHNIAGSLDGGYSSGFELNIGSDGSVALQVKQGGSAIIATTTAANAARVGTWTHVALVKSGTTYTIYINGVNSASTTGGTWSEPSYMWVGALQGSTPLYYLQGYISNFRVVKGTAVYTANFTPPTAPLTAITNTSLLLNFTNAGIVDASAKNDLVTVGNAQISTAQSKFGGSSMAFDGSGDYLIGQSTPDLTLGTGDFTIEFWAYINAQGTYCFYDQRTATNQVLPTIYTQSGQIRYYVSQADRITGSTLSASQWYHIALTRSGTSTRLFVNGTQVGSTYTDANNYIQSRPVIGVVGDTLGSAYLNGYIDDLRITKGVARYTANFTPPTAPFPPK